MELKRTINNKSYLFCISTVVLTFLLGYFLLVGVDKIENVTIQQLIFSNYTVLTQFGHMLFPFVIIYSFSNDYKDKNILFYKKLGINAFTYFILKVISMIVWFTIGIVLIVFSTAVLFNNFTFIFINFMYFENVMIYIIVISALMGFIFKNMIFAFGANLIFWVFSIIVLTIDPRIKYIAYYDATNYLYLDFEKYLGTSNSNFLHIGFSILYNVIVLLLSLILVKLLEKQWSRNGI